MSKNSVILLVVVILIFGGALGFWVYTRNLSNNKESKATSQEQTYIPTENCVTDDFRINGRSIIGKKVTYSCYFENDFSKVLSIDAKPYNLPDNLLEFSDELLLRITYDKEDLKVYECKVVDPRTNEIVNDTSKENINKLFNIEYGKKINKIDWPEETILLSGLKEGEIYSLTSPAGAEELPKIENDTNENCIVYINKPDVFGDETAHYEKEVYMNQKIDSYSISYSYSSIEENTTIKIMYKKASTEDLLRLINEDDIVFLSKQNTSGELSYTFEKYIYNDTNRDIHIVTYDEAFGMSSSESYVLKAGEIYEFGWGIDKVMFE